FGNAVAIGSSKAVVSAVFQEGGGAVYVFDAASGALLYPLARPGNGYPTGFGSSVAVLDDRLLVGDPTAFGPGYGAIHVFDFASGNLMRTIYDPVPNDPTLLAFGQFGSAMASLPSSVLVGAPLDADLRGTVYVVDAQAAIIIGGFQQPNAPSLFGDAIAARGS